MFVGLSAACFLSLLLPLTFHDQGLGEDETSIILGSTALQEYRLGLPEYPRDMYLFGHRNLLFMLFNASHGWLELVWMYGIYAAAGAVGLPLYTWVLLLPATLATWLAGVVTYCFARQASASRGSAALAAVAMLLAPVILVSASRSTFHISMAVLMRSLFFLLLVRSVVRRSNACRAAALLCMGLVITSENAFIIPCGLGALLVIGLHFQRNQEAGAPLARGLLAACSDAARFFWHPALLFPLLILGGYAMALAMKLARPFGIGFLAHTIERAKGAALGWPPDFFAQYLNYLGIGLGVAAPLAIVGGVALLFSRQCQPVRPVVAFLLLWCLATLGSVFMFHPREIAGVYLAMPMVPLCVLVGLCLQWLFDRRPAAAVGLGAVLLLGTALGSASQVFNWPWTGAKIYGTPRSFHYARTMKAVGTILRTEGVSPAQQRVPCRTEEGLEYWEPLPIEEREIVLAGTRPEHPYVPVAVLYWGADVGALPNESTQIIVIVHDWGNPALREECAQHLSSGDFRVRHLIYDGDEVLARMYYRGGGDVSAPRRHQQAFLVREWDRRFARLPNLLHAGYHFL